MLCVFYWVYFDKKIERWSVEFIFESYSTSKYTELQNLNDFISGFK